MKLLIALLLSVAIFLATPKQETPVYNSVAKVAVTKQAEPTTPKQSESKAEVVAQVETPVPQTPAPQPEQVSEPTPSPEPVAQPTPVSGTHEEMMAAAGIPTSDWAAVDFIVSHESTWCYKRMNGDHRACSDIPQPYLGDVGNLAYGLCQALPASKMASEGDDYMTNPVTQLRWCTKYASQRYGGWWGSFAFWSSNRWW